MELKYKENSLWKVTGSVWLLVSLMNVGLMLFLLNEVHNGFGLLFSFFLILMILLSSVLAVFYFKINTIDYIRLNDSTLSIHNGLVLPRKKITISEIEQGRVIRDKFVLILKNEKEVEISLKQLSIKDYEKLIVKLKESFLIS